MNPLRALLWKEGREASYKIAIGACLGLFVGLLVHVSLEKVAYLVGLFGAVLMGMDAVAGERSRGTLPFLFIRPLDRGWLLGVKFMVGAAGLLVVLAAYWAGVYLGLPEWGNPHFLWGLFSEPGTSFLLRLLYEEVILADVGYVRIVLLWFFLFLILYTAVFLASAFSDRSAQAVIIGLMTAWVGLFCLGIVFSLFSDAVWYYLMLVFHTGLDRDAGILRRAFDPSLLLARVAGAVLLAGGVLLWTCRAFRAQASRRFQWTVGAIALISGSIVMWLNVTQSHRASDPTEPVGRLWYQQESVVDLALQDRLAVVLLEQRVSVVDVADWRAPREIGQAKIKGWQLWRLALSGSTAYVWGSSVAQDSVGVVVFDLSQPERPQLRAQRFLYPIGAGGFFSKQIPRLVGWAAWDGYLYAGLLGSESLELHSFDVREGGLPQPVHVLPIAERDKHVWNNNWEMCLAGPHAFLTLGHDFVVLDLTDPRRPEELSRTPLRRFGRSKRYEESIEKIHRQLSVSFQVRLEETRWGLEALEMRQHGPDGEHIYRVAVPPGLGPISLSGDKAYIQRYWPQELAVLDIADLRRPVEVDYVPNEYFSGGLTMDGDFAYALRWNEIGAYAVAEYGALWRRKTLGFAEEKALGFAEEKGGWRIYYPSEMKPYLAPILAGDHICAIMRNNFVVFEALQDD